MTDYKRTLRVLQAMTDDIKEILWVDATLNNGGKVEMTLFDNSNAGYRKITVGGEILQDNILKTLRDNREESLTIELDELNSLIKEGETV